MNNNGRQQVFTSKERFAHYLICKIFIVLCISLVAGVCVERPIQLVAAEQEAASEATAEIMAQESRDVLVWLDGKLTRYEEDFADYKSMLSTYEKKAAFEALSDIDQQMYNEGIEHMRQLLANNQASGISDKAKSYIGKFWEKYLQAIRMAYKSADAERTINAIARIFDQHYLTDQAGELTYKKGILIANKNICMPYDFHPGEDKQAAASMASMKEAANSSGIVLNDFSTYRSAQTQERLFNSYAASDGEEAANRYSSRAGCSDHQTGRAFDIGSTDSSQWAETTFDGTDAAVWLEEHAPEFGFILRYPQGKEEQTGYIYESWHYRYVGDIAPRIKESQLSLEEYLELI